MSSPRQWSWWRRHDTLILGVLMGVALIALAGYNVWAAGQQNRNNATAAKVAKLSKGACSQTQLFFDVFNALVDDTSPSFGSPPDGPPVPGARAKLIRRLDRAETATRRALRGQGCRLK